jgi:hypothetical protein
MQYIIEFPGHIDKFTDIVVGKLKPLQMKQMLDVSQVTRNQVVHPNDVKTFFDKPFAKMRS